MKGGKMKTCLPLLAPTLMFLLSLALVIPCSAQAPLTLDSDCTVTVGNQAVAVSEDGAFYVQNIAIFQSRDTGIAPQLYRVRATCLRNGEMIIGQSDFFSFTPGETTFIGDVFPSDLDPIPVSVELTASTDVIALDDTLQLSVIATFSDGSTEDVTQRSAGTTYISTNTNLLTVSQNGRVRGVNSTTRPQSATIAVLNEGNLGSITFTAVGNSNDFDNDGMPNDYEELFGLNQFSDDSDFDLDGDGLTNLEEFELGTLPNNSDTDLDGIPDGMDGDPLRPEFEPPTVRVIEPLLGTTLLEGQTIDFTVDASDDGILTGIDFFVNGALIATKEEAPFVLTFTVPYATDFLEFSASAMDAAGNTGATDGAGFQVINDPLTRVRGTVVDTEGNPAQGADVSLKLGGLLAEFFDFDSPLNSMPDLSGLTPDATKLVSAVNLRNPGDFLSPDTFGLSFSPDFAARFSGWIRIQIAGLYGFFLSADDGARLFIDGDLIAEVTGPGDFTVDTGTVNLSPGSVPIEIEYYQAVGGSEIQLSYLGPDDTTSKVVPPEFLFQATDSFTARSRSDGTFVIRDVPANLGEIDASVTATIEGVELQGTSEAAAPIADGVTELGIIELQTARYETDLGINLEQTDDTWDLIPFTEGFSFPYYGSTYSEAYVGSNGYITFQGGDSTYNPSIPRGVVEGLPRISAMFVDLDPRVIQPGGGVYVNQFPDRFVVTWYRLGLFFEGGDNTIQIILYSDGRIQYGYNGLTVGTSSRDISVAVSPGGDPAVMNVDFSAGTPFGSTGADAPFENFSSGAEFDMDGGFITFTPNVAGGFDVTYLAGSGEPPPPPPPPSTIEVLEFEAQCIFGDCSFSTGEVINFEVSVEGSPDRYEYDWTSPDGAFRNVIDSSNIPITSHIYTVAGSYEPVLRIIKGAELAELADQNDSLIEVTEIAPPPPPPPTDLQVVGFAAQCSLGFCGFNTGQTISFTVSVEGSPTRYEYDWTSPDGVFRNVIESSTTPVTSHAYTVAGSYKPVLRIVRGTESAELADQNSANLSVN